MKYPKLTLRNVLLFVASFAVVSGAVAGIPCPDPLTYHIHNGSCSIAPCILLPPGGFIPDSGSYTNGGCIRPGHSAYSCDVKSLIVNMDDPTFSGPFTNGCDWNVYGVCTPRTVSIFGIKYGESNTHPCCYATGN